MLPQRTLDYIGSIVDFGGYLGYTPFRWNNFGGDGRNRIEQNSGKYMFQFFVILQLWMMYFYEIFLILDFYINFHGYLTFKIVRIVYCFLLCRYFNTKYRMIVYNCDNYQSFVNGFLEISRRFGYTGDSDEIEIVEGEKLARLYIRMCVFFFSFSTVKTCLRIFTRPHLYSMFPFDMVYHPVKTIFLALVQVNIICYQNYLFTLSHVTLAAYIFSIRPIMKRLRNSTRPCPQLEYQVNDPEHKFEELTEADMMETEFGFEQQQSGLLHVAVLVDDTVGIVDTEREEEENPNSVVNGEISVDKKSADYCYKLYQQLRIIENQFKETFSHKTMVFEIFELFLITLNLMPVFWLIRWNILVFIGISLFFVAVLNAFACIYGVSTKTLTSWSGAGGLSGRWSWLAKFRRTGRKRNQFYFSSRRLNFTVLSLVVFGSMSALV